MTRAEAIDTLDTLVGMVEDNHGTDYDGALKMAIKVLQELSAQPERMKGHWTEKEVVYIKDVKDAIDAWQSCKCSECGRYDTRPYMYYFAEPRFCSYCGAEMERSDNG